MKKFSTAYIFILFSVTAIAQNYRTVVPNQEKYFIDQSGFIRGAKAYYTDTIGTDTIINNFYAVENDTLHCPPPENYFGSYNVYGASWLGRKIVVTTDGINKFYNSFNEEIVINVEATQGNSWTAFNLGSGNYLEATVDTVIETIVLGNLDSVKVISLQAKDVSNNSIAHIFNGKEIHIGKQTGFVKNFNILDFPTDTAQYFITDKSRMTRRDVYEYNIGDVVQIKISDYDAYQYYDTLEYVTRTILEKVAPDTETLDYIIKREHLIYRTHYDWPNHLTIPVDTTIYVDTVNTSYNMLSNFVFYRMPEESTLSASLEEYKLTSKPNLYNGRRVINSFYDSCLPDNPENDTCYHYYCCCDGNSSSETYIEGLGKLFSIGGWDMNYSEEIIYYEKGNETYGTLFTSVRENMLPYFNLYIYPNPTTNTITLDLPSSPLSKNTSLKILNTLGQTVYQSSVSAQKFSIDVSSLGAGIYFLSINDGEKEMRGKFIKE